MSTDIWIVTGTDGDARTLAREAAGRAGVETGDWVGKAILWAAGPGAPTVAARQRKAASAGSAPPRATPEPAAPAQESGHRLKHADASTDFGPEAKEKLLGEDQSLDDGETLGDTVDAGASTPQISLPLKESAWARLAQREWSGQAQRERAGAAWRKWAGLARNKITALAPNDRTKVAARGAVLTAAAVLLAIPFLWTPAGGKRSAETTTTKAAAVPDPPKPRPVAHGKPTGAGDPVRLVSRLKESASAGDADAQHDLGLLYAMGRYVKRDGRKAAIWLHRATATGLVRAQFNLALVYDLGQGVLKNRRKAFLLYLRAAQRNHVKAQHNLATAYARGAGIRKDYSEAARWFAAAAAAGAAASQFSLGLLYEYGVGVARDRREAIRWYGEAARQGEARAAIRLGEITTGTNEAAEFASEEIQYLLSPVSFDTRPAGTASGGNR